MWRFVAVRYSSIITIPKTYLAVMAAFVDNMNVETELASRRRDVEWEGVSLPQTLTANSDQRSRDSRPCLWNATNSRFPR